MAKAKDEKPPEVPPPAPAPPAGLRATVRCPGRTEAVVEIPAGTPEPERHAAAVEAYKAQQGVWALPEVPAVAFEG